MTIATTRTDAEIDAEIAAGRELRCALGELASHASGLRDVIRAGYVGSSSRQQHVDDIAMRWEDIIDLYDGARVAYVRYTAHLPVPSESVAGWPPVES